MTDPLIYYREWGGNLYMKTLIALVFSINIVTCASWGQEVNTPLPASVRVALDRALASIDENYLKSAPNQRAELPNRFQASLASIADLVDEKLRKQSAAHEGNNIDAKLVIIALYRKQHPELFDEIDHITTVWLSSDRLRFSSDRIGVF
jgi:hypothetical protein